MITMIKKGQILEDGDYVQVKDIKQVKIILGFDGVSYGDEYPAQCVISGMLFFNSQAWCVCSVTSPMYQLTQQYSFEAFRELCENTFK